MTFNPPHLHLLINGTEQPSNDGETYKTYDSTGQLISIADSASWDDIESAIETASAAQPAWEKKAISERRDILLKASEILVDPSKRYLKAFEQALKRVLGEKVNWRHEVYGTAFLLKGYAAMSSRLTGETFPSRLPGGIVITQRRAYGVVLVMVPWNSPLALACRVIPLAIQAGNTVVFRSSELAPQVHQLFTELLHDAGLPPGVLNLIHISRENNPTLVPKIIAHKKIKLISFTGSTVVGRAIATEAGKNLKEVLLELGGKAAAVVLEDADVKQAARSIISGAYNHAGQICMATSRVIVQRSIAKALISELKFFAQRIKAGSGEYANIISVRTVAFAENIIAYVKAAKDKGAEVAVGDMTNDGAVVHPHLLLGYSSDMKAWQDELFGPVLGVIICDTVDEAIELVNDTEYSLTNSLWTNNLKALEWASRIYSGMVIINGNSHHSELGIGSTGLSGRSGYGTGNIESYTQNRTVVVFNDQVPNPLLDSMGL